MFNRPASIDHCRVCRRHPSICTCYPLLNVSKAYHRRKASGRKRVRTRSGPSAQSLPALSSSRRKR